MTDWIEAVSRRAEADASVVGTLLASLGIEPGASRGTPRPMTLSRISFDGEKRIHGTATPFEFGWNLGPGVNCIASGRNLVGKTSVLEAIRWCLRGRSDLRGDVQDWLSNVQLDLIIATVPYRVAFSMRSGHPVGAITRSDTGAEIASFTTHQAFEAAADAFFIDALGLTPIVGWQGGGDGAPTIHGWAALSDVLRVTESTNLLASEAYGGINGRLLDLFTGLSMKTGQGSSPGDDVRGQA